MSFIVVSERAQLQALGEQLAIVGAVVVPRQQCGGVPGQLVLSGLLLVGLRRIQVAREGTGDEGQAEEAGDENGETAYVVHGRGRG
ncbi:hypothetical protein HYQ46_001624 [Verticillium longisporum]|nr:hypothetical protein HYQ46_001624 [Verticillium longisporum]